MPHSADVHAGVRLKLARKLRNISQTKLGESVGVSFQQIQKYEQGTNRMAASRLHEFARFLDVPVSFFFEQLRSAETGNIIPLDEDSLSLVEEFRSIDDENVKQLARQIIAIMAKQRE